MDDKTQRKIDKTGQHVRNLAGGEVVADLMDWLHTPVSEWDADVLRQHAKALEATGCHLRRLVNELSTTGVID